MSNYEGLISSNEVTFKDAGIDASALITRTDTKGNITFASKGFREMTLYDKNELIGKPHNIIRHPFMPKAVFKEMWDTIKEGRPWSGIVVNKRKDNKHYWVRVFIDAIDGEGNIVSALGYYGGPRDKKEIAGYIALRREPTREEVKKAINVYKKLKAVEGIKRHFPQGVE